MAYLVDSAQTFGTAAVTAAAVNMPPHAVNDILILQVTVDSGTATFGGSAFAVLPSAPVNPVTSGTISYLLYRLATSAAETLTITTVDAFTCSVTCWRDVDTTTPFDAVTPLHAAVGAATSTPVSQAVTTQTANAIVVYGIMQDGTTPQVLSDPGVMWLDGFDSTGTTATTSSHQAQAWYPQRAAGASPAPGWVSSVSGVYVRSTFALRNKAGGRIPAYIDDVTVPATRITPGHHTATQNNIAVPAALTNTAAINGKTVSFSAATLGADFGINPYASALGRTAAITAATLLQGFEITLTGGRNFSTGLVMGSLIALNPKSGTFGLGSVAQGGFAVRFGSSATDWMAYQVAAKDTPITTEQRYVFAVQPGYAGTDYGTPGGTYAPATTTYVQCLMNCPSFAANVYLSELHQVFTQVVAGGDATNPVNIDGLVAVGRSFRLPVIQPNGAAGVLCFAPIQIGGGDAVNFVVDAGVIQFPRRADAVRKDIAFHADNNRVGFYDAGKSGDTVRLTNSLVTAPTPYVFEVTAGATSAATRDYGGLTVVNATVKLRNVMTFTGMAFAGCPSIDVTGVALQDSSIGGVPAGNDTLLTDASSALTRVSFDVRTVTAANRMASVASPAIFNDCTFVGGGAAGHALRITTPGTYGVNSDFQGFGATGTNFAAIFNDSGGAVTINFSGGGTPPTYRNGAGASTTVNSGATVTFTGLVAGSDIVILTAGTSTILQQTDSHPTTSFAWAYSGTPTVDVGFLKPGYVPLYLRALALGSLDASIPVAQAADRNYS